MSIYTIYIDIHTCTHTYRHMYIYTIIYVYIHIHIYKYTCINAYTYIYMYSTEDHLLMMSLLIERLREFNLLLWLGLVDFERVLDRIDHQAL